MGILEEQATWTEKCMGCGECMLAEFGGICPVTSLELSDQGQARAGGRSSGDGHGCQAQVGQAVPSVGASGGVGRGDDVIHRRNEGRTD